MCKGRNYNMYNTCKGQNYKYKRPSWLKYIYDGPSPYRPHKRVPPGGGGGFSYFITYPCFLALPWYGNL